jgi:hypothetical protein
LEATLKGEQGKKIKVEKGILSIAPVFRHGNRVGVRFGFSHRRKAMRRL